MGILRRWKEILPIPIQYRQYLPRRLGDISARLKRPIVENELENPYYDAWKLDALETLNCVLDCILDALRHWIVH